MIFRGDSGLYLQDGNSRVRLDSNFGAIFALKTTTITAGDGLSGGGDLSANRTITANTKIGGGLKITTDSLEVDSTSWIPTDADVATKANSSITHTIKGTANQITVTGGALVHTSSGSDSLSLPQDIATASNVTFNLGRFDTIGSKTRAVVVDTSAFQMRDTLYMRHSGAGSVRPIVIKPMVDSVAWELDGGGTTRNAGGFLNVIGNMYTGTAGAGPGGGQMYAVRNGRNSPNVELGQLDSATDLHHYGYRHASDGSVTLGSGGIVTYDNSLKSLFMGTVFGFIPDSNVFLGLCEDETNTYIRSGFYDITSTRSALMTMDTAGPGFLMRSAALITGTHPSFRITDDAVNKVTKGLTQSADTSAVSFSFTNTGKPQMFVRGITGNALFAIDSQYVGVGIATPTYQFHVRNTTASDISGTLLDRTGLAVSTANRYRILELGTTLSDNSPNAGAAFNGLECNPFYSGSGTLASLYGAFYSPRGTGASDTITTLTGTAVWLRNTSTGKVGTGIGYDVLAPTNAGTWTTNIGVRIANQGLSGMTTSTGLQIAAQAGASNSYAITTGGGNVGISTATPDSTLHVSGSLHATSNVKFDATITGSATSRGSDAFTTTATTDTVTVSGGAATDYYFITLTGTAAPVAADAVTVEALVGKFVLHRSASGTSGLTYNWFRIK